MEGVHQAARQLDMLGVCYVALFVPAGALRCLDLRMLSRVTCCPGLEFECSVAPERLHHSKLP